MMKLNKVMKGISFLLCLGFLAVASNAEAKTCDEANAEAREASSNLLKCCEKNNINSFYCVVDDERSKACSGYRNVSTLKAREAEKICEKERNANGPSDEELRANGEKLKEECLDNGCAWGEFGCDCEEASGTIVEIPGKSYAVNNTEKANTNSKTTQSATPLMDDYIKHMNANYRECLKTKSAAECQKEKDNYSEAQYKKDKQKEAAAAQSQQNSANNTTVNNTPSTQSTGMTEDQWNKYNATSGNYSVSPSDPSLGSKTSSSTTSQSSNTNNNKPSNAPAGVQTSGLGSTNNFANSGGSQQVSSLSSTPSTTASSSATSSSSGSPISTKQIKVDSEQKDIDKNIDKITNSIKSLGDGSDSGGCQDGVTALNSYKQKASAYIAAAKEYNSAVESVTNACSKYSKIKSEYNSCLSGGKGVNVSQAKAAEQKVSLTKAAMERELSTAQSAVSSCSNAAKDVNKAQKAAEKADKKADKALEKLQKAAGDTCSVQEIESGKCAEIYEALYNNCGDDAKACKNAYKEWQKIKELEDKYKDKTSAAQGAKDAVEDAEQQKLNARCPGSEVWNKQLEDCVLPGVSQEDIDQCSGRGYYLKEAAEAEMQACFSSIAERNKAKADIEKSKKEDLKNKAQSEYDECLKENKGKKDAENTCAAKKEALDAAAAALAEGNDSKMGAGITDEQIQKDRDEAIGRGDSRCSGTSLTGTVRGTYGIFDYLACKITTVVADVRVIVYILACFGMIAFAYGAIIGKINWKQLANMGIGLFVLSMMTSFIEYFAYNGNYGKLPYGSYLPNGNHAALMGGSGDLNSAVNCSENNPEACPDVQLSELKEKADKSSFSWSDIKSAFSSARDAVNTVTKAASTVRNTVNTTMTATGNIVNAIKNGGNVIDVAATIGTNIENISRSIGTTSTILAQAGSSLSNSIQDAQMTNEQRAYVDQARTQYQKIAEKCGTGCNSSKCNAAEQKSCQNLKAEVDKYTTGVDQWLNNDGRGGGATILAGIEKTTKAVNAGAGVTRDVQQAKNQGESQGDKLGLGSGLSSLLGIGYAIEEGANSGGAYVKQVSQMDYRSQQTKTADAAADALAKAYQTCIKAGGTYNESTKKCTKAGSEIDLASGAEIKTTKNADGSTTRTSVVKNDKGGTVTHETVTQADGSVKDTVITRNEDGTVKAVITENGKKTTLEYDAQGNKTVNGISNAQQDCIEKQGGQWVNGQCINATRVSQNEIDCKNDGLKWSNGKCDTSEKDKCLANKDIWLGAKGCEKVSDADKCSDGEEWDSSKKQCKAACPENQRSKAGGCCANGLDENGYCNKCPAGKIPNKNGTGCCDKLTADGWCDTMPGVDFKNNQNATAPQRQSELCKKSGGEWDAGLSCCKELGTPLKNITDFERCNMHNTSSKTKNNTKNNNSAGNDGVSILINGNTNQNQGTDWSKPQIGNTANKAWGQ